MYKILILYYSGVGNTKRVANKICSALLKVHSVEISSIENLPNDLEMGAYDALVLGFPTIHAAPALPMLDFINGIQSLKEKIPTFLFTTCGLYSENTLRTFANICIPLNIIPVLCKSYRCSATDGILLAPFMKIWFKHERNLDARLERDAFCFIEQLGSSMMPIVPRIKLYSFINYLNKWIGQRSTFSIYLHNYRCNKCGKCMKNCSEQACVRDADGFPLVIKSKCINCYRCIHHCPESALSLSKKQPPKKTLYSIYGKTTPTQ